MEPYLGCRKLLRSSLTRLRDGACNLQINLGRRHRPLPLPVEDRICDFCMPLCQTLKILFYYIQLIIIYHI